MKSRFPFNRRRNAMRDASEALAREHTNDQLAKRQIMICRRVDTLLESQKDLIMEKLLARIAEIEGRPPTKAEMDEHGAQGYPELDGEEGGRTLKIYGWKGNPVMRIVDASEPGGAIKIEIRKMYDVAPEKPKREPKPEDDLPEEFDGFRDMGLLDD